jgi:hypothetical protein
MVDNIPGVVYRCLMDDAWTMLFISDEIEVLSGYPANEFLGENPVRTFASIMHEDDLQPVVPTPTSTASSTRTETSIGSTPGARRSTTKTARPSTLTAQSSM